jgi:hypothetical protein
VAKKTNKKNKKTSGDGTSILGASIKNAGLAIVSTLIGEIVAIAVQKLLAKNSQNDTVDNESDLVSEGNDDRQNPIQATTSKLQDTVAAVKSTTSEQKHTVTDLVDALKEATQQVLHNSVNGIKNESQITANTLIDTAKNAIEVINTSDRNKSKKKGKKKSKKSKDLVLKS